jgi:hypothetical protein
MEIELFDEWQTNNNDERQLQTNIDGEVYIYWAFGDMKEACIHVLMTFFFQPSGSSKSSSKRCLSQKLDASQKLSIDVIDPNGKPLEPKSTR